MACAGGASGNGGGTAAPAKLSQKTKGCKILPRKDAFHRKVNHWKLAKHAKALSKRVRGSYLHPDFGSNPHYGIPFTVVGHNKRKVKVHVRRHGGYPGQSDKGRRPIPKNARVEGGRKSSGDRHTLVIKRAKHKGGACKLIELYKANYQGGKAHRWAASQVSVFNLSKRLPQRKLGWTSADAAGLPILPGLVRYSEVRSGHIRHAIRITFEQTRAAYRLPASHFASDICAANRPAMGDRVRLRKGYKIGNMSHDARVVAKALKTYGGIVADNGTNFYITGASDRRWNDNKLNDLKSIPGRAFQFLRGHGKLHRSHAC